MIRDTATQDEIIEAPRNVPRRRLAVGVALATAIGMGAFVALSVS